MHVRRIAARGFMRYSTVAVDLPERGVVLVTGPNGAGKSSLVEAVSVCGWGRTLRGTDPWQDGAAGLVEVSVDAGLAVSRARAKGRTTLRFAAPGVPKQEHDTATKAQEALESIVGSWETWRSTSVFSSADAAHFSLATDGERKRLLEELLDVAAFDAALAAARADLRAAEEKRASVVSGHAVLSERAANLAASLSSAEETLASLPPDSAAEDVEALRAIVKRLSASTAAAAAEIEELRRGARVLERTSGASAAEISRLEADLSRVRAGTCHACGQPVNEELRGRLRAALDEARGKAAGVAGDSASRLAGIRGKIEELSEDGADAADSLAKARSRIASAEAAEKSAATRRRLSSDVERLRERLVAANAELEAAAAAEAAAARDAAVLAAVEQVLGLRGVRASLLSRALSGLEQAANARLARIAGTGLSLRLKPYAEKKTGGVSDAISLEVEGAGGGRGYRAASQGERRRIDVALLLALADAAAAARGARPGTLFFDEVFDALDEDGIDLVSELLSGLSADRCVVVVTHSAALESKVSATMRIQAADGQLAAS